MASAAVYGLIGFPLAHSFSRDFFTRKFREESSEETYLNFETPELSLEFLEGLRRKHPGLRGLNVTAPHKRRVFELAHQHTPEAASVQAANTLRLEADGSWTAHNTDIEGFRSAIAPMLAPHHKGALICGTGGAAQAVCRALSDMDIDCIFLSRQGYGDSRTFPYEDAPCLLHSHSVIVNATPLGTFPRTDEAPPLPYDTMGPDNLCFDLVYNPPVTLFIRQAIAAGAAAACGIHMLRAQAIASYEFWNKSI